MADAAVDRAPEHAQARDAQGKDGAAASTAARKRRALMIIGGVAGVIILGVLLYVLLTVGKETTDDAQLDADVVPLAPHVGGQVVAVPVAENQAVKKAEVILQIDDRDCRARVAQAQSDPGQPADVAVDTYGRTLHGKVESLSGGTGARFSLFPPDNATGNFVKVAQRIPVRIALDSVPSGMVLRAGQSVVVTVHVNQ